MAVFSDRGMYTFLNRNIFTADAEEFTEVFSLSFSVSSVALR